MTVDLLHSLSRDVGTFRPIQRVQLGWWVHLEASPSGREPAGWERVDFTAAAAGIVTLFFVGDQPALGEVRGYGVVTLTAGEARCHGLVEDVED